MNGKLKVTLSIAGVIAMVSMVFYVGYTWAIISTHLTDIERHQTAREKELLVDERIALHLLPLRVEIREMNKKLDILLEATHE
jgi:hypothetical protein